MQYEFFKGEFPVLYRELIIYLFNNGKDKALEFFKNRFNLIGRVEKVEDWKLEPYIAYINNMSIDIYTVEEMAYFDLYYMLFHMAERRRNEIPNNERSPD